MHTRTRARRYCTHSYMRAHTHTYPPASPPTYIYTRTHRTLQGANTTNVCPEIEAWVQDYAVHQQEVTPSSYNIIANFVGAAVVIALISTMCVSAPTSSRSYLLLAR